jgi:hypothetical protein
MADNGSTHRRKGTRGVTLTQLGLLGIETTLTDMQRRNSRYDTSNSSGRISAR